jgi:hypothetical protein
MVKYSGGVAMLKDVIDWRPPRRHDGVITFSPPAGTIPSRLLSELPEGLPPASEVPLPRVPPGSPGVRHAGGYSRGVVTSADCGPWAPPRPRGGLIVEDRGVDLPDSLEVSAPPAEAGGSEDAPPKRRARKR